MRHVLLLLMVLLGTVPAPAQVRSPLAAPPEWAALEPFQETMTREEFGRLLAEVYAPGKAALGWVEVGPESATVQTGGAPWVLRFAHGSPARPAPHPWQAAGGLPPAARPLEGVKIALDPGHLGGKWARMEERFFQLGESRPVTEGDLTLRVAQRLGPLLEKLGAHVLPVRSTSEPVTAQRPENLLSLVPAAGTPPARQRESELLFYRQSEIRARARRVNEELRPDLTVCLHFNAEAWGDPQQPEFVPRNHLHALVNGCYAAEELALEDVRFEMLLRLLSRTHGEELAASEAVVARLAQATRLPPYTYTTDKALRAGASGYVWARNLLANRLYHGPVVFLEPYVMNSEEVWERVQAGDYEGELLLAGRRRPSIFREYAEAVAQGLADYYGKARATKQP